MKKYIILTGLWPSYRYKTKKGEISRVNPNQFTGDMYEIYCIAGKLFEGIERYETLEKTENRIEELLV